MSFNMFPILKQHHTYNIQEGNNSLNLAINLKNSKTELVISNHVKEIASRVKANIPPPSLSTYFFFFKDFKCGDKMNNNNNNNNRTLHRLGYLRRKRRPKRL
jgi:hypothetical protein